MFYYIEIVSMCIFVLLDSVQLFAFASGIKYASIMACAIMTMYYSYKRHTYVFVLPLFLICIADYYLLFTTQYEKGILLFFIIQNYYYYFLKQKISYVFISVIGILFVLSFNPLYTLSIGYSILTFVNLFLSYQTHNYLRYTITLLALCDLCVVLQYFGFFLPYVSILIWVFYLPSQLFFIKSIQDSQMTRFIV